MDMLTRLFPSGFQAKCSTANPHTIRGLPVTAEKKINAWIT